MGRNALSAVNDLLTEIDRLQAELEQARGTWVPFSDWRQEHELGEDEPLLDPTPRYVVNFNGTDKDGGDGVYDMLSWDGEGFRNDCGCGYIEPDYVLVGWQPPEPPESEVNDAER